MVSELAALGIRVHAVYMSPHHWNENSFQRKPAPGMFFQAAKEHLIRLDHCLYIGDDERDCVAAANAGCGMVYLTSDINPPDLAERPVPYIQTALLSNCIDTIIDQYLEWELENDAPR
jgi:histidinol phosphatase-like enzyme